VNHSGPPAGAVPGKPDVTAAKQALRRRLIQQRRTATAENRARAGRANAEHLLTAAKGLSTVCAFLPLPSEPLDPALLDLLTDGGVTVLVPLVTGAAPLDWADWSAARHAHGRGDLPQAAGPAGIVELTAPALGPAVIAGADLVLIPALAVDRAGYRLGRGGGHYDRTLALLASLTGRRPPLVGVLYDGEVLDEVPHDVLDVPVTSIVTPRRGLQFPS
jgi:5-formyltetrahydrofolate cyclo-ligase